MSRHGPLRVQVRDRSLRVLLIVCSDARLYTQLLYYSTVFDAERARQRVADKPGQGPSPDCIAAQSDRCAEEVIALAIQNEGSFRTVKTAVDRYLARCGRRYVQLGSIFSFMRAA